MWVVGINNVLSFIIYLIFIKCWIFIPIFVYLFKFYKIIISVKFFTIIIIQSLFYFIKVHFKNFCMYLQHQIIGILFYKVHKS